MKDFNLHERQQGGDAGGGVEGYTRWRNSRVRGITVWTKGRALPNKTCLKSGHTTCRKIVHQKIDPYENVQRPRWLCSPSNQCLPNDCVNRC